MTRVAEGIQIYHVRDIYAVGQRKFILWQPNIAADIALSMASLSDTSYEASPCMDILNRYMIDR